MRDVQSDGVARASVSSAGEQGNGASSKASISADGRYVVFRSGATNLVAGDTNAKTDIFLRDMVLGQTTRVSTAGAGVEANGSSSAPVISADGRFIAYESLATNLVADDTTGGGPDIFVLDRQSGETMRLSVSPAGAEANGSSYAPSLSSDGRYVAFWSYASNLVASDANGAADVFVRDMSSDETTLASVSSAGVRGNGDSYYSAISADGLRVAFSSDATNLDAGDNNAATDVFVRDLASSKTTLASVSSAGARGDADSFDPAISADGSCVAFDSKSSNLVASDTNDLDDIFVRDMSAGVTKCASVSTSGAQSESGSLGSYDSAISADGLVVLFSSYADNLVAGDTNVKADVFMRKTTPVAEATTLTRTSGASTLSAYGKSYAFTGKLTAGGTGVPGQKINLQSSTSASGVFVDTGLSATTAADGSFSIPVVPTTKTYYRARYAGMPSEYESTLSTAISVLPRAYVRTPIARSKMSSKKSYTVWGTLKPKHTAGTYPVRIYKWKKTSSGKWKKYGYVKAKAYNYSSYTKYSVKMRLKYKGTWRLRAYAVADAGHAAAWSSKYDYVKVK